MHMNTFQSSMHASFICNALQQQMIGKFSQLLSSRQYVCRLVDLAKRFHRVLQQRSQIDIGKLGSGDASRLQQLMRRSGLPYYSDCELTMYQKKHTGEEGDASR